MKIEPRELTLLTLDGLDVDGLALFVDQRERPLQGLAGLCDWRLCGQLSRVLETGFFEGKRGEALLMPTAARLKVNRILAFGIESTDPAARELRLQRSLEAAQKAGLRSLALSIDWLGDGPEVAAAAFARAAARSSIERVVVIGDGRALVKALGSVLTSQPGLQLESPAQALPPPSKQRA